MPFVAMTWENSTVTTEILIYPPQADLVQPPNGADAPTVCAIMSPRRAAHLNR